MENLETMTQKLLALGNGVFGADLHDDGLCALLGLLIDSQI